MVLSLQTVTEKHKLNVPETMTEVLDVSDEEGKQLYYTLLFNVMYAICIKGSNYLQKYLTFTFWSS